MLYCFGVSDPLSQISNGAAQTRRKGSTPLNEVRWMFVHEITLFLGHSFFDLKAIVFISYFLLFWADGGVLLLTATNFARETKHILK